MNTPAIAASPKPTETAIMATRLKRMPCKAAPSLFWVTACICAPQRERSTNRMIATRIDHTDTEGQDPVGLRPGRDRYPSSLR